MFLVLKTDTMVVIEVFSSLISAEDPTFIFLEFYSCNQPLMLVLIDNNNTNMSMMGHYLAEKLTETPQLVFVHLSSAASPQHGLFVWVTHGNKACYRRLLVLY